MLSRLIPSTRSIIPRAFSALSSPSLSRSSSIRSFSPISSRLFSSIAINTTAPFKVSDEVSEKYNKLALELAYQAEKWDDAKKAAYKAELAQAEKTKDSAAVIAVMQKHIIQRTTLNDIVQKFGGWYPLLGLTTIAAFSKEIFLLNEEVLLATNFLAVVGTLYINYSDVVLQQYYDDKAADKKQQKEVRDLHIDSQKALIKAYEKNPLVYTMLKDLKTEYNTLFEKKVKVSFARQRVAAHQSISKKLNDIHARELEEELRLRSYIQKAAIQYVLEKYSKLSAAQKNGTTDYAIDRFAGGKTDLKKDIVRQLFLDYFKNKEWEKMAKKH